MSARTWDSILANVPAELVEAADEMARQAFCMSLQELSDKADQAGAPLTAAFIKSLIWVNMLGKLSAARRAVAADRATGLSGIVGACT